MAREKVGEIRINTRTVRIGHQVYPLANISRVQTLKVVWAGRLATAYPVKQAVILLIVFAAVAAAVVAGMPALGLGDDELSTRILAGAGALSGVRLLYLVLLLLYRALVRRGQYALVLETAGTQYTALTGTDRAELYRIEGEIVGAIEHPPRSERVVQVHGDLVVGDQHKQTGANSQMTFNR